MVLRDLYTVAPGTMYTNGEPDIDDFTYVLWTGASWKGVIGSAEISATLEGIPTSWVVGSDPPAKRKGRTFLWSFRDFEPSSRPEAPDRVQLFWRIPPAKRWKVLYSE